MPPESSTERRPFLVKAFAAQHWTPLRWPERNRGLLSAVRTVGFGLNPVVTVSGRRSAQGRDPLGLAGFATLGCVLELLVVEEQLLPGGEDKLRPAVNARQNLVLKFH